jgi:restriction system protein
MARRNKSSPAEDFIAIASKLPWWVSLLLAVVSYLLLHAYASRSIEVATAPGKVMDYFIPSMLKGIATFGQYVLPMLLVIAAGLSWYKSRNAEGTQRLPSELGRKPSPASSQQSPSCPVCSSAMRLREAKRGANSGKSFWGCSDYPRCKGTRTAD